MIIMEFKLDQLSIDKVKEGKLENIDPVDFSKKLFVMPVHLNVDNVEMLEMSIQFGRVVTEWPYLPVVDVATYWLENLYDAWHKGSTEIWISEIGLRIDLTASGDNIDIHSRNMDIKCSVPYTEAMTAFTDFATIVREILLKEIPDLVKHPYWGAWFEGEVKTPWRDWKDD